MDFIDKLKQFSKRVDTLKDTLTTEEATKTSIIMPFFSLLGYDVFNPQEFLPEFTADVGIKKGEKVDYAIMQDGQPIILIEAKWAGEPLEKHDSQLFRYFGTTKAKFAILTNGIIYRFYTDLSEPNKMDETPFLEINILDIKDNLVPELKKFHKDVFNVTEIFDTAAELKYSNKIRNVLSEEIANPSNEFVQFFLQYTYSGKKTQNVIDKFKPIVKKTVNQFINELLNDKFRAAMETSNKEEEQETTPEAIETKETTKPSKEVITTEEELEGYFIVKNLLKDIVPVGDITYKDTINYFNILYKGNTWKWICRLYTNSSQKYIAIPDENKKEQVYPLQNLYEIEKHKDELIEVLKRYI